MANPNDTFGPWIEDGGDLVVDGAPFWLQSTSGIVDLGNRSEWDVCQLGDFVLPGLANVTLPKKAERKVDVKSPSGTAKATLTVKGWEPAEVEIQLLLWTPVHWSRWREIRPLLRDPTDRKESAPFEIYHPVTYDAGIDAILVNGISGIADGSVHGTKTVKISGIEWCPQPKVTGSSTPGVNNTNRDAFAAMWQALRKIGETTDPWEVWAYNHGIRPPGPAPPLLPPFPT